MIRVVLYGVGPIGVLVARQLATRSGFRITGAVDSDPSKAGIDLGELAQLADPLSVNVSPDARTVLKRSDADAVVLCTSSSIEAVMPQIDDVLNARIPLVTTTEELSYPVKENAVIARKIDARARKAKVAVLSTGVNPGFVMDTLPIVLSAASEHVDSVTINRIQDARTRRLPFQQKIGAGLTLAQFDRDVKGGRIRHVGLAESISMIADAFGWRLDRISDQVRAKVAEAAVASDFLDVRAGYVSGIIQDGVGYRDGKAAITLHMEAYLGAPDSYDSIDIEGTPALRMTIHGGVPGDVATASIVVNSIPKAIAAPPGLQTMRHLPLPSYFSGL